MERITALTESYLHVKNLVSFFNRGEVQMSVHAVCVCGNKVDEMDEIITSLSRVTGYKSQNITKNQTILLPDTIPERLLYVEHGSVRLTVLGDDGHELDLDVFFAGDFIGASEFLSPALLSARAITRTDVRIASVPSHALRMHSEVLSHIFPFVAAQAGREIQRKNAALCNRVFLQTEEVVLSVLHDLALSPDGITHPDGMQVSITRQDLARIIGRSREMVGKVIAKMHKDGIIYANGKKIVVYNTR